MKLALALLLAIAGPSVATAQGLGSAPVIFTSGDWTVRKNTDNMTDQVRCTGIYLKRFDVQLSRESLYISLRGRGGVKSYTVRIDDLPPRRLQLASRAEASISMIDISGPAFRELLGAQRLRVQVLTVLSSFVDEDISLLGVPEAHAVITGPECK